MYRVLTLERECGAGGSIVARMAAERLGWNLLDRAMITAVSRAAQVDVEIVQRYDEHVDSWWRQFHRAGIWAAAIAAGSGFDDARLFGPESVAALERQVISQAAARSNCAIVGRGGQCILRDREDVLHVFVYGPWSERVSRVRSRLESSADAEEVVRSTDEERAGCIRTYYECDWKDPHLYDIMINSHIGIEKAADLIVETVQRAGLQALRLRGLGVRL